MVASKRLKGGSRVAEARLAEIGLPDFGMPGARPEMPPSTYALRLDRLRERAESGATTGSSSIATASTAPT